MWKSIQVIFSYKRLLATLLAPVLLLPLPVISSTPAANCGYVVLLMSVYWMFELIPLPITALIPVVLFPILNIMGTSDTSLYYMKSTVMLYVSGLMVAVAVENSNLHRRIALKTILLFGTSPRRLMLGFMVPTALLSMWISNTATTAMMVPIIEALLADLENSADENDKKLVGSRRKMMMLAVAYAANIGGTGTIIGTSPNLILFDYISQFDGQPISFGSWIAFCFPELILNLILCWIWLQLLFVGIPRFRFQQKQLDKDDAETNRVRYLLQTKYNDLGPITFQEVAVLVLFLILVFLWFFRSPGFMTGWADLLQSAFCPPGDTSSSCGIGASTPAFFICILLFVIPAKPSSRQPALVTWSIVEKKLPWGVVVLMGGGFAMAEGCNRSGLNSWIGGQLIHLRDLDQTVLLLLICLLVSVVTQVASNAATASMLLPVLLKLSQALQDDKSIADPGIPPFYSATFFETIKKVYTVSPQKLGKMTEAEWYHLLLEENVTKEQDEEQVKTFRKCRVETANMENDWETSWRRMRLRGLGSELTSFLFKVLHQLLATQDRLLRINQAEDNSAICKANGCSGEQIEDLKHALIFCPGNGGIGLKCLDVVKTLIPDITAEGALFLQFESATSLELPVVWFLSTVWKMIWEARSVRKKPALYKIRSEMEARIALLRTTGSYINDTIYMETLVTSLE